MEEAKDYLEGSFIEGLNLWVMEVGGRRVRPVELLLHAIIDKIT